MRIDVKRDVSPDDRASIDELLRTAELADGAPPLSDHAWLDLVDGGRPGFAALVAHQSDHQHPVGYAQVSRGEGDARSWSIDLVIEPHHRLDGELIGTELLTEALTVIADQGGGHVHFWVTHPTTAHDRLAAGAGLTTGRDLLQLRLALPISDIATITTRTFDFDRDAADWVEVNNRAFNWHPEQGGWTVEALRRRAREPWFDPAGFLVHERDGRMAGFCWTKMHTSRNPVLGEIYVIATDPDFQGLGLGRQLTVAGLTSLAERGAPVGMLYVDAANIAAVALYERLGFTLHHVDRAYVADIGNSSAR